MKNRKFRRGEQVCIMFKDSNGNRKPDVYGYVVEYIDSKSIAVLITHDTDGNECVSWAKESPLCLVGTGKKYKH